MRTRNIYSGFALLLILLSCPNPAPAQGAPIDTAVAHKYFREARTACERDGGRLWGRPLCGPVLFVHPATRAVVANQADPQGLLAERDGLFVGRLPDRQPVANAPVEWAGVRWVMIVWSFLTDDEFQRVKLITHESFHRVQNELKLPVSGASNEHLDSLDGRVWLQLEWRALSRALTSRGAARRRAVEDALTFRSHRRTLFPQAEASERSLEMHEGLAEYTGFRLGAKDTAELIDRLTKQIEQAAQRPSFVASFAYASGPAYGVLLDAAAPKWQKGLTPRDDLGLLLRKSLKVKLPADVKAGAERQSAKYGGAALRLAEAEREAARRRLIADYRARLVDGPTLLIPLTDKRSVYTVNTNVVPLDGAGTAYPTARVTDEWGVLEVSNGALMIREGGGRITRVYVPAPADPNARPLKGDGWTLQLHSGWSLTQGQRKGDYTFKRTEP